MLLSLELKEYTCKLCKEIQNNEELADINFITPENDKTTEESKKYLGVHRTLKNNEQKLKAHWFVGMRWLIHGKYYAKVTPKINNLDYFQMYLTCLNCNVTSEHLERTFGFHPEEEFIPLKDKETDISPLIIAYFLKMVYDLVRRGIKYGFMRQKENLAGRIKGRILVNQTISKNLATLKPYKTICDYQIFSVDCIENQILKLALEKVSQYISHTKIDKQETLNRWLSYSKVAFDKVSPVTISDRDFQRIHYSNFYKEYKNAHKIARLILKRFGFDIHQNIEKSLNTVPPFWIDMNELFERYCEALLRKYYSDLIAGYGLENGNNFESCVGKLRPDFLLKGKNWILDAKYKDDYKERWIKEDIAQLCMYSKHTEIRTEGLGLEKYSEPEKLIFLYPDEKQEESRFKKEVNTPSKSCKNFEEIYKIAVPIPLKRD